MCTFFTPMMGKCGMMTVCHDAQCLLAGDGWFCHEVLYLLAAGVQFAMVMEDVSRVVYHDVQ
jgi:hypothetical protein